MPRWVYPRQRCDPRALEAAPIDAHTARAFICTHHYSGSYPSVRCRVGIFEYGELVGVATFGVPAGPKVLEAWTGFSHDEAIELNRFVLLDRVGYNGESRALRLARGVLRDELPGLKAILAFSDPIARTTHEGTQVMPGHVGTIYQATNAAYMGRSSPRSLVLDAQGKTISPRLLQKIRQHQSGHAYATQRLLDAGAPPPLHGESPRAWLMRVLPAFRKLRHPGNHAYVWSLQRGVRFRSVRVYPKLRDPTQLGLL